MTAGAPIVVLERLRASDRTGTGGRLFDIDAVLGPGVHAVLGAPRDGTLALADVLAGRAPPLAGRARVAGHDPARSAAIRAHIGVLAAAPELPDGGTVAACVGIALRARGEPARVAASALEALGLASLLARRAASLSFAEARAVELALALTTPSPRLLCLVEPLADVAVPSLSLVRARILALGAEGACVVLITSSPADARALGDRVLVLDRGVLAGAEPAGGERLAGGPLPGAGPRADGLAEVELLVLVREPGAPRAGTGGEVEVSSGRGVRALAAGLARSPAVRSISWEEGAAGAISSLRVRAADREQAALVILDAIAADEANLVAISSPAPSLREVQATAAPRLAAARGAPQLRAPKERTP
jgi:ABC-2 type transport system ATP-binding protein